MLELNDIHVFYGSIRALNGVSLRVNKGQLVALIGSNGAGKSTTLKTISGLLRPREGKIVFSVVDLPAPFEPISATSSPLFTRSETPPRARMLP